MPDGFSPGHLLGTAVWADPDAIGEQYAFRPGMFWLGRHPGNFKQALGTYIFSHIFLVAETQTSKGRAVVINNCLLWLGSLVAVSTKTDTMEICAARRGAGEKDVEGLNQKVVCLDPMKKARIDPSLRGFMEPIAFVDPDDPMVMATRIAEGLTIIRSEGDNKVWDEKAIMLIAFVIAHLVTCGKYPQAARHLVTVFRLMLSGKSEDHDELARAYAAGDDRVREYFGDQGVPSAFMMLLREMELNQACDGIISEYAKSLKKSERGHERYIESVRASAIHHLRFLLSKKMRDQVTGAGMDPAQALDPAELKTHPNGVSAFVTLPSSDRQLCMGWEKMVTKLLMDGCKDVPGDKGANGHKVLFSLDEFLSYGRMKEIETGATEYASAGVALFLSVQKLSVLKDTYKDAWETFIGAANVVIAFGLKELFTLKYFSDSLGQMDITRIANSENEQTNESVTDTDTTTDTTGGSTGVVETTANTIGSGSSHADTSGSGRSNGGSSGTSTRPGNLIEFFPGHNRNDQWSRNSQSSVTRSRQKNQSQTISQARQSNSQWSSARSQATAVMRGSSRGKSRQDTFHKRPLLEVNEARREFATFANRPHDHRYPGLALIMLDGEDPFPVRKCFYDEDDYFVGKFTPSKDHEFIPVSEQPMLEHMYTGEHFFDFCLPADLKQQGYRLLPAAGVRQGAVVPAGAPLAVLAGPKNWQSVTPSLRPATAPQPFSSGKVQMLQPKDYRLIRAIKAPFDMKMVDVASPKATIDDFSFLLRRQGRQHLPAPAFNHENGRLIKFAQRHQAKIKQAAQNAQIALDEEEAAKRRREQERREAAEKAEQEKILRRFLIGAGVVGFLILKACGS